jgi:hypothetical protein
MMKCWNEVKGDTEKKKKQVQKDVNLALVFLIYLTLSNNQFVERGCVLVLEVFIFPRFISSLHRIHWHQKSW